MKTIVIIYTYTVPVLPRKTIPFHCIILGQTDETPEIAFIRETLIQARNFDHMVSQCDEIYKKYFHTDNNNLTHIIHSI
jgi:hypothetical protein